jgi:hypothetical protein
MIKVIYETICDLCHRTCNTQIFECSNQLGGGGFPHPGGRYTYQLGRVVEMCYECAGPIVQACDAVIERYIEKRREGEAT